MRPSRKTVSDRFARPKLSTKDPALQTLNKMAELLEPFSRLDQLKTMAAVCCQLGQFDEAKIFLRAAEEESGA